MENTPLFLLCWNHKMGRTQGWGEVEDKKSENIWGAEKDTKSGKWLSRTESTESFVSIEENGNQDVFTPPDLQHGWGNGEAEGASN